ncbi:MAG: TonB-dependent receptor [Methylomicrobium sp.]|nr:TonB-dependent receptor [Methylomicrobium sp.]
MTLTYKQLSAALLTTLVSTVHAENRQYHFEIPAQPLSAALQQLALQSGSSMLFAEPTTEGKQSANVIGLYSLDEALKRLLAENAIEYKVGTDGTVTLKPATVKNTEISQTKPADNSVFELGNMVISSEAQSKNLQSRDILSSVDIMNADKIENQNVLTAFDLFHRMPGIQITQFNQGTTTGKFSFRGFNGEGNINGVKLLIDGIPSNTNDGNMPFIDAIFPLDIESLEVVRGTNDPRYGLHAIAGNANIFTYQGGDYVKGRVSYGSFDTHDIQTSAGYESGGLSQNYSINYRATNGYRDHASSEKTGFSGKWFYTPESEKFKVGLITRWSNAEAEEPGYLTFQESRNDPTQSRPHNSTDGGDRQMGQVSGHLDVNLTDDLFWALKSYANTIEDKRFVRFSANVSQQERLFDEVQYGAITSLTYAPEVAWLNDFSVETGFDFQQQENKTARYLTQNRSRTAQTRDQEFDFLVYGGYVQTVIKPFEWLKFTPGFRVDQVDGSFENLRNGSTADINNYGTIWQPKAGVVLTPFDGYSLYGNWGRTFQVAVGSASYKTTPTAVDLEPSINEGWEVGIKLQPADWAEGRIAYWQQSATNEWRRDLNSPNNDATNIGATDRQGVDVQVKISPVEPVSVWATFSLQEAIVVTPPPATPQFKDNKIDHTPNYLFSGGIDYQITPALKSSLWTTGQGNYFPDEANNASQFGEYALLNLDLGYQVSKEIELQFQIKNLTDTYWEYVWHNGSETLHSPGDGRAFYGAVSVNYDL